ncbi:hypothetical protein POPTR_009G016766v4 [Populus trichocarpa]|uniref:Uncharacterized protein n=1 Tax=Populus trichocarpa TaxID=3694 RepID=A0ACC0SG18_POPTR|nr:hypothetical protein POPTR_009G016766v4 [Populus trichocarpa]
MNSAKKKPQSDCSVGFLTFSFLLLHTKHASSRHAGTVTSNVPGFEKMKMTVVLCYLRHRVLCFCLLFL